MMKQHTTPEQTAKLIELGFEKPSPKWVKDENGDYRVKTNDADYDIGELLPFLPDDGVSDRRLEFDGFHWLVDWDSFDKIRQTMRVELIDALYDMLVKLKEERVI